MKWIKRILLDYVIGLGFAIYALVLKVLFLRLLGIIDNNFPTVIFVKDIWLFGLLLQLLFTILSCNKNPTINKERRKFVYLFFIISGPIYIPIIAWIWYK